MDRLSAWLLVLAMLLAGCSDSEPSANTEDDSDAPAVTETTEDGEKDAEAVTETNGASDNSRKNGESTAEDPPPLRKSLEGNWILVLHLNAPLPNGQQRINLPAIVLAIEKADDPEQGYAVRVLETRELGNETQGIADPLKGLKVESATITPTEAAITFINSAEETIDFRGQLQNGVVYGSALDELLVAGQLYPARLVATAGKTLAGHNPGPIDGQSELEQLLIDKGPEAAVAEFVKQHPETPLALDMYNRLIFTAKDRGLTEQETRALIDDYVTAAKRWGPRLEQMARMNVGFLLNAARFQPKLAIEYLKAAEEHMPEDFDEGWKQVLDSTRKEAELLLTVENLKSEDEATRQAAAEELHKQLEETPFNAPVIHALAEHERRQGKTDEAIPHYAKVVALPMLERQILAQAEESDRETIAPPSDALAELWKEKHGDTEGLDAYLREIYTETVAGAATEKAEPRKDAKNAQTVLVELLTGAQCPPCVAADMGTAALEHTYDRADVLVLRYHVHIPGPDPLTNQATLARAEYYQIQGTPTVLVNGEDIAGVGGFMDEVRGVYDMLRQVVETARLGESDITLKLSAEAKDDTISLSANAEGLDEPSDTLRLRLALVEAEIPYVAGNGIRSHEMVVRAMPGGAGGVAPKDGALQFEGQVDVGELRQELGDYLAAYEEYIQQNQPEDQPDFQFDGKPLDLDKFYLVAFLQDDKTKAVLQTAVVPVSGMLTAPPMDAEPTEPVEKPAEPQETPKEDAPPKDDPEGPALQPNQP